MGSAGWSHFYLQCHNGRTDRQRQSLDPEYGLRAADDQQHCRDWRSELLGRRDLHVSDGARRILPAGRKFHADYGRHLYRDTDDRHQRGHAHLRDLRDIRSAAASGAGPDPRRSHSNFVSGYGPRLLFPSDHPAAEWPQSHRIAGGHVDRYWRLEPGRLFADGYLHRGADSGGVIVLHYPDVFAAGTRWAGRDDCRQWSERADGQQHADRHRRDHRYQVLRGRDLERAGFGDPESYRHVAREQHHDHAHRHAERKFFVRELGRGLPEQLSTHLHVHSEREHHGLGEFRRQHHVQRGHSRIRNGNSESNRHVIRARNDYYPRRQSQSRRAICELVTRQCVFYSDAWRVLCEPADQHHDHRHVLGREPIFIGH